MLLLKSVMPKLQELCDFLQCVLANTVLLSPSNHAITKNILYIIIMLINTATFFLKIALCGYPER